jgi:glycosyltransferase involved in cell wall biosynthesis
MKIAVFTKSTTLHKNHGGLETQNRALCEGLAKKGHEITVFSPKKDIDKDRDQENGVNYVFIESEYENYIFAWFKKNSWTKKSLEVFSEINEKENFDIVLGQSASAESIIENKSRLGVKVVSIAHGTTSAEFSTFVKNISSIKDIYWLIRNTQYFFRQFFGRQRRYVLHSDMVVAVSNYVKKALISETFVDESRVKVIHNGVDPALFKKEKKDRDIGGIVNLYFIGRLEKSKGILTMIDIVRDINRDVVFHIVGDGPCMEEAKKRVGKYHLQEKVSFHGRLSRSQVSDFIKNFSPDIFVFPTQRVEGFPMVIVESMLAGIPTVAFDLGGVSDAVVDGETGYLIEPGNNECLKNKLVELIDDRETRIKLGENSKEKAEKEFIIGKMVDSYENIFMEVIS